MALMYLGIFLGKNWKKERGWEKERKQGSSTTAEKGVTYSLHKCHFIHVKSSERAFVCFSRTSLALSPGVEGWSRKNTTNTLHYFICASATSSGVLFFGIVLGEVYGGWWSFRKVSLNPEVTWCEDGFNCRGKYRVISLEREQRLQHHDNNWEIWKVKV